MEEDWEGLLELKDMARRQGEQIRLLSQWVELLQRPQAGSPGSPKVCWRCRQPGHLARNCDGQRVPASPRPSPVAQSGRNGRPSPRRPAGDLPSPGLSSGRASGALPNSRDMSMPLQPPTWVLLHSTSLDDVYAYGLSRALIKVAPPATVGLFSNCPSRTEAVLRKIRMYMNREADWREKKHHGTKNSSGSWRPACGGFLSLLLSIVFLRPVWGEEEEQRRKRVRWIFVQFSAWHYAGSDKLWAGLVIRLFKAIQKDFGEMPLSLYRSTQHPYPKKIQREAGGRGGGGGGQRSCWKVRKFLFLPLWLDVLIAVTMSVAASVVLYRSGFQAHSDTKLTWTTLLDSVAIGALGLPTAAALRVLFRVLKNLFYNQGSSILKQMNSTSVSDQLGFMNKVRKEVAILVNFIHFMETFEDRKIRVVLEITNLDRCSPDKVIQTLEAINILLAGEDVPFVSILAVDPGVVVKCFENSLFFGRSRSNGHEFLNQIVTLPFNVPEMCLRSKCVAFRTLANSHLEVYTAAEPEERGHDGTTKTVKGTEPGDLSVVHSESTVPFIDKSKWDDEESLAMALTWEVWAKKVKRRTQEALECIYDESKPLHIYLPANSVHMRRIINSVRVTVIVTEAVYGDHSRASDIAAWVVLVNTWPCRLSWILQCHEDSQQRADLDDTLNAPRLTKTLWEIFSESRGELLGGLRSSLECVMDQDGDPELFERFLKVDFKFTVADVVRFGPCTVNLDHSIKKELARLRENGQRNVTAGRECNGHDMRKGIAHMTTEDICSEMQRLKFPVKPQQLLRASGLQGAALAYGDDDAIRETLQMTSEEWSLLLTHLMRLKT
ncbi:NTPase KAP family P-loop domain-containing protein 1-like [Engraulis encrasicolus]|uniref:NTPase KAP family P-loop domain-containing protein 1-like n=1 Tax=Engraulis encrasicolus TaxID=184585 RepID=UPI002FD4E50A